MLTSFRTVKWSIAKDASLRSLLMASNTLSGEQQCYLVGFYGNLVGRKLLQTCCVWLIDQSIDTCSRLRSGLKSLDVFSSLQFTGNDRSESSRSLFMEMSEWNTYSF